MTIEEFKQLSPYAQEEFINSGQEFSTAPVSVQTTVGVRCGSPDSNGAVEKQVELPPTQGSLGSPEPSSAPEALTQPATNL